MLRTLTAKNLTVFPEANLMFAPGLNVIVGENGCGKSHLLKVAYSVMAASCEEGKKPTASEPTKTVLQKVLADKLGNVMRPESLGRLARRKQGRERCELGLTFSDSKLNCEFSFATSSKSEVQVDTLPKTWHAKVPVFLPTRDLLSIYPNFVAVYDNYYLEYEETYRDTCVLLGAPALKGAREKQASAILAPLEHAMGGSVVLEKTGRFYLRIGFMHVCRYPLLSAAIRISACAAKSAGRRFRKVSRFASFQRMAGRSAVWLHPSKVQSGSARTSPARDRLCLSVNCCARSQRHRARTCSSVSSEQGTSVMPTNARSHSAAISLSLPNSTSCGGRLCPAR